MLYIYVSIFTPRVLDIKKKWHSNLKYVYYIDGLFLDV